MRLDADLPSFVINLRAMKYGQFNLRVKNTIASSFCIISSFIFIGGFNSLYSQIIPAAHQFAKYVPALKGKKVGLVANHTTMVGETHLADTLIELGVQLVKIFAPEHGFRGDAANGEHVKNAIDPKSGLTIVSLYGKNKKPSSKDLKGIEAVIFDMQDVGVRFYTYLTTMHYIMEACAENNIPLWILDRPNPNGHYVDGPILDPKFVQSMVGMHAIPLVHGMTLGELALMIKGEKWISKSHKLKLNVIPVAQYDHNTPYKLPVPPSPNLQSQASIILYPSLGLFEGTIMSMGRGTAWPFEVIGAPWFVEGNFEFTPKSIRGKAVNPPYENQTCKGIYLKDFALDYLVDYQKIYLVWILEMYKAYGSKPEFFNNFFDKLAGTPELRNQIIAGKTEEEIRSSWESRLTDFRKLRKQYLLYPHDETRGVLYPTTILKKP